MQTKRDFSVAHQMPIVEDNVGDHGDESDESDGNDDSVDDNDDSVDEEQFLQESIGDVNYDEISILEVVECSLKSSM